MQRLLQAVALAALATGATYLLLHVFDSRGRPVKRRPSKPLVDEDDLTREEQEQLLRELSSLI